MADWKVNAGYQIFIGDKRYVGGEKFSATEQEVAENGAAHLVSKVEVRQQSAPKAVNKAVAKPEAHQVTKLPAEPVKPKAK